MIQKQISFVVVAKHQLDICIMTAHMSQDKAFYYKMAYAYAPSEDSGQPAHPHSLIKVFAGHPVGKIQSVFRRMAKCYTVKPQ